MQSNRIPNIKADWDTKHLREKVSKTFRTYAGSGDSSLVKDREFANPFTKYQRALDNQYLSAFAKRRASSSPFLNGVAASAITIAKSATPNTVRKMTNQSTSVDSFGKSTSIVENAKKYLGTPYVWGGESMDEGGMDCSGFVYNALKDSGYNVGRTTAQGYRNYGTSVPKADMQPGDLVFFGKGEATHIGIYLGDGKMIHSSGGSKNTKSNPGKGVVIGDVNSRSDFIEARRY